MFERDTINRLFLELSQFVTAKTALEIKYERAIEKALDHLRFATPKEMNGPCYQASGVLKMALGRPTAEDMGVASAVSFNGEDDPSPRGPDIRLAIRKPIKSGE